MISKAEVNRFLADISESLSLSYLWINLALVDIRVQYQRSFIGPFWITLATGIFIWFIAILYGGFFDVNTETFLPYLAVGWIMWRFLAETVNGGASIFIMDKAAFNQIRLPIMFRVFRLVALNTVTLAHNFVIYVIVAVWAMLPLTPWFFLVIPAFAIWILAAVSSALIVGVLATRFRDVGPIVGAGLQVSFFLTPIIWTLDVLPRDSARRAILDWNFFIYYVEIIRDPLIGNPPEARDWLIAAALTLGLAVLAFVFGVRTRARIPYWV